MNNSKGQISPIIMWAGGLLASALFTFNGYTFSGLAKTNEVVNRQAERITATEVRIERLPIIEAKLDKLLEQQNISPSMVERSIGIASSTSEKVRFQ